MLLPPQRIMHQAHDGGEHGHEKTGRDRGPDEKQSHGIHDRKSHITPLASHDNAHR